MAVRKLILAVDHSPASHEALEFAVTNLYREGDELHFVHCFKPLQPAVGPHYSYVPSEEEQANWRREQSHVLEEFVKDARAKNPGLTCRAILISGDPREELIAYAETESASMIVVGSRGRGALKRAILGSVSTYVVTHSKIPVVVCHAKA
ncbi:uncharacterized protein MONBRDRAFT_38315 [Monosiga brevicollis MX1]|uniref:UspA domain-containing protein n=1 Tax=Monosiga brevicollis TaxID=81824 RepID=A9V6Y7_MONBE|nr:uncharacterized protein MONBRDRAFT_38315 [Monosiga brevicollis MX1]EDQ86627.1 predicted protein [Monosiga brevicollis MX1]|eukprot:XP_001748463.1 hypothetical protein [Monosiga brevicollis MX1]